MDDGASSNLSLRSLFSDLTSCLTSIFNRRQRAVIVSEHEIGDPPTISSEGNSAVARSMEGDGLVVEMNVFNADSFFSDDERVVKAVLFTRKAEIPALWRQVAMANLRIASFGLVRHSEEDLMQRFQLTPEQLPRVVIFLPGLATKHQTTNPLFVFLPLSFSL